MRERPILFSGAMVRALLDDRKTQTRRVVKAPKGSAPEYAGVDFACPYGAPGDRLWVRETWARSGRADGTRFRVVHYQATDTLRTIPDAPGEQSEIDYRWRPSIHMPRWASRITLEITDVRVERVEDISDADAEAEGCTGGGHVPEYSEESPATPYEEYAWLWDTLNEKRGYSWNSNPWVWALTFRRVTP